MEIDWLNQEANICKTNHLHIYLKDSYPDDLTTMNQRQYGIFLHEYVHYIQHFITLFGIKRTSIFMNIEYFCFQQIRDLGKVNLPINLLSLLLPNNSLSSSVGNYFQYFSQVEGNKTIQYSVDDIEVNIDEILRAKQEKSSVNIGIYSYDSDIAEEKGFKFGYWCIIEGMAYLIQSLVDPTVELNFFPYYVVETICDKYLGNYKIDKKMQISICICSLMYANPGVAFFDLLDEVKQNRYSDGRFLYMHLIRDSHIKMKGKSVRIGIEDAAINFLEEYKKNMQSLFSSPMEYYSKVIDNCIQEFQQHKSILLDLIYSDKILNVKCMLEVLWQQYGLPIINSNNAIILPKNAQDEESADSALLLGGEILYTRFCESNKSAECPWFPICNIGAHTEYASNLTSVECLKNQWDKKEDCLFRMALKALKLDTVEYCLN